MRFNQRGTFPLPGVSERGLGRSINLSEISTVDFQPEKIFKSFHHLADRIILAGSLVFNRYRYRPFIILHNKYYRKFFPRRPVNRLMKLTFACSALAAADVNNAVNRFFL